MRVLVGHSDDPATALAAAEATAALVAQANGAPIVGILLYVSPTLDVEAAVAFVRAALPGVPLIGCTTDGECSSTHRFCEDSLVLTGFCAEHVVARAAVGRGLARDPDGAVRAAWAELCRSSASQQTPALVIAVAEGLGADGVAVTRALAACVPPAVPVVGGTAGDQWRFQRTRQVFGDEVVEDAVALLALYGSIHVGVGLGSGWRPIGPSATVTRSEGAAVAAIDGQPALAWFREHLGASGAPSPEFPFAVYANGDESYYLRAPLRFGEADGSIVFAAAVPEGCRVRVTVATRDAVIDGAREAVVRAAQALGPMPVGGLLVFSCAARKQVLGTRTHEELDALCAVSGDVPIAGFYTYGEIAPSRPGDGPQFHNETVVAVLIGA